MILVVVRLEAMQALVEDARGRIWVAEGVNYRTWNGRNPGRALRREAGIITDNDATLRILAA